MNLSHSIGAVGADDRKMGHANFLAFPFFDDAHALNAVLLSRKPPADIPQKTAIDLIDNLKLPGQHILEPCHRPFFECFGQQGVIGVPQRVLRDVPSFIPLDSVPGPRGFASARRPTTPGAYRSSESLPFPRISSSPNCRV